MTSFPSSPRLIKSGLVLINPSTSAVLRVIALQYNPDTLTRTLQVQGAGSEGGDRSEALRLKGPPVETIKLDAVIDAADQLEFPEQHQNVVESGLHTHLAVLETTIYPTSATLNANNDLANIGTLEIAPMETALMLFIWSSNRILPVRLTEFSITEEAFDPSLNPIRAKVSLGMRVLNVDDLGFDHKGGSLFMSYLQNKEQLSAKHFNSTLNTFGIEGI